MAKSNGMKDPVTKGRDTSRGKANNMNSFGSYKPMRKGANTPVHIADKGKPKK